MVSLTQTRCFNHAQREAVARCPSCMRHFCRECVTEHDHRLLCASCLAQAAEPEHAPRRRRIPFRPLVEAGAAVFVLWTAFYVMGQALMLIPSEFHDTFDSAVEDIRLMEEEDADGDSGDTAEADR